MKKGLIRTIKYFIFNCPGCNHEHSVPIEGSGNDWIMTGTEDNPSLSPSILNYIPEKKLEDGTIIPRKEVCHLFIKEGYIEYCNDSQHNLVGKIVEMKY